MGPLKVLGSKGCTISFYQHNWPMVGPEICEATLYFLNSSHMDGLINVTNISLIPKGQNPSRVIEFRPISLCNVLYKIISKVLANRLKVVLPIVISSYQSVFLSGRLISNNIIATYETLHTMHMKMWCKVGFMGIKLDMNKAYDKMEWEFLEAIIGKMGFSERWIKLIMECVCTITYSIIVNGQAVGRITPSRRIRQMCGGTQFYA
jgi:hypothetical protein